MPQFSNTYHPQDALILVRLINVWLFFFPAGMCDIDHTTRKIRRRERESRSRSRDRDKLRTPESARSIANSKGKATVGSKKAPNKSSLNKSGPGSKGELVIDNPKYQCLLENTENWGWFDIHLSSQYYSLKKKFWWAEEYIEKDSSDWEKLQIFAKQQLFLH